MEKPKKPKQRKFRSKITGRNTPYEKQDTTIESLRDVLERDGFAVLPGVLNPDEVLRARSGVWGAVEELTSGHSTPVMRGDPSTWGGLYDFLPKHGMLFQHYPCLTHSSAAWDTRLHPDVRRAFSEFHGTDKLYSSFDGISISVPHRTKGMLQEFAGGGASNWFHIDQVKEPGPCVQGLVNLYDVEVGGATFVGLKGSHRHHAEFVQENDLASSSKSEFHIVGDKEDFFLEKGCEAVAVKLCAGDLLLWDSRLVHMGRPPLKKRQEPDVRMVIYTCWKKTEALSQKQIEKRLKMFKEGRTSTHGGTGFFPTTPRLYPGQQLPPIPDFKQERDPRDCLPECFLE